MSELPASTPRSSHAVVFDIQRVGPSTVCLRQDRPGDILSTAVNSHGDTRRNAAAVVAKGATRWQWIPSILRAAQTIVYVMKRPRSRHEYMDGSSFAYPDKPLDQEFWMKPRSEFLGEGSL